MSRLEQVRFFAVSCVLLSGMGLLASGRVQDTRGALRALSLPVSPSVVATVAASEGRLVLLVLWRGAPRWYSTGAHRGANYSGIQDGVFGASLQYGEIGLDLSFNGLARTAEIQGKSTSLPANTNVLLIDGVSTAGGGRLVKALSIDPGDANLDPRVGNLGPLLSRSPEVAAFLQCGKWPDHVKSNDPCKHLLKR